MGPDLKQYALEKQCFQRLTGAGVDRTDIYMGPCV